MSDIEYGPRFRVTEFKSSDAGAEVAGYVSTYGNVDHGGDVVMHGAFDGTLKAGTPVRFLWAHDTHEVIGKPIELRSDDNGLFGRFQISQTARGRDIHTLLKDGAVDSFSIGYVPTDIEYDEGGTRLLKSVDLLECSVVAMPMNSRATVTAVKQDEHKVALPLDEDVPFEKLLGQVAEHLKTVMEAAEALQARRPEEKGKLSTTHVDAIHELLGVAEAATKRLEEIAAPPPSPPDDGMKLRLELARKLEARRALLETA